MGIGSGITGLALSAKVVTLAAKAAGLFREPYVANLACNSFVETFGDSVVEARDWGLLLDALLLPVAGVAFGPLLPVSGVTLLVMMVSPACRCPCAIFKNPRICCSVRGRPAAITSAVLTSPGFGPRETELAGAPRRGT